MNLQENIRRILKEETKSGKYLSIIKNIIEPYEGENAVCDIDVNYDQEDDMYTVMVNIGLKQLDKTFHPVRSLQREWHVEDIRNKVKNEILGLLPIENIYVGSTAVENCNETINESKILDKIKSFLGKKPLTKDDKLIDIIVKFIEENYSIDFESDEEGDITFYLTNDTGNWIFPPIMKYFPTKKLLNYNWKFAEDIHTWIGDDRLLQPDSEMMGKIFEKLFNKKVNKVFGFSRL